VIRIFYNVAEMHAMRFGLVARPTPAPLARRRPTRRRQGVRPFLLAGLSLLALGALANAADAAAVKAAIKKDVLAVTGTPGADAITLRLKAGDPNTLEVDVGADGIADFSFDRRKFTAITVDGGTGPDNLFADNINGVFTDTEKTTFNGGDGNDTLIGGAGAEKLSAGPGDDFVDGQQGTDTVSLGDGADVVQWDPGDGSDTVAGGLGPDRLAFNGSGATENFVVSNAGGHVRFTRDVAAIVLDLDDLEVLDLRPLGGPDTLTVNDLAGTDMTEVRTDLAAVGGGDDGQIDEVIVAPGLVVGSDGPAAVVNGLGAQVRVLNGAALDRIHVTGGPAADVVYLAGTAGADTVNAVADGTEAAVFGATPGLHLRLTTVESLEVDLAGGDDSFSAVGNLAALVAFDVDGGEGADNILGSNGADVLSAGPGDDFVDGQQGSDTVSLGDGADVVQWDPGDGSDTVAGGLGPDRLAFNGSGATENFVVSNAGGHVRFTRDVAAIVLDLDDLEVLDLRPLGGPDTLTVNDLAGTDMTEVRTDLAAVGGADDGQVDEVIVNGTAGDDTIAVTADGSAVVVQGLATAVRITGANPSVDRLTVNGREGNDTATATPEANTLIVVTLVP
jgi:Ca2+-binding RTX toxin-like protein